MELRKDILKISKKSRFRIIMGMGFFLIAIFWVADRAFEYHDIRPFDWLYFSFFIFSGIIHTYEGFVAFTAKTKLIDHYEKTLGAYHFKNQRMIIDTQAARILVEKYFKA